MNRFMGMVILKPNIEKEKIDFIQSNIVSVFKQNAKVQMVWNLGKRKLEYETKKYTEGIYLKIEILAKTKNVEFIKEQIKHNEDVIFSIIIKDESERNTFPIVKKHSFQIAKIQQIKSYPEEKNKVYMLVNKNIKLPFAESDIIGISTNIQSIFQLASKKIQDNVFIKGYYTTKKFKNIKDVEKDFKRAWKIEFVLGDNPNVGQQLLIQEKNLI